MAHVWNLPGPARPGYLQRPGRAALFLGVLGLGVIVATLLTSLGGYGHHAIAIVVLLEALAAAANTGMYFTGFGVLTPQGRPRPRAGAGRGRRQRLPPVPGRLAHQHQPGEHRQTLPAQQPAPPGFAQCTTPTR